MTTIGVLLPFLAWLASTAGAGTLAFALFRWLRSRYPLPADGGGGLLYTLLYAPRYARYSVLVLSALISIAATAAVAALSGADVLSAVDTALAAALSAIMSQVMHAGTMLPNEPPMPKEDA